MSENLLKAIYAYYTATPANAFYTATAGRMNQGRALESWTDDFATIQIVTISPDNCFRQRIDDVALQINVFSSTSAGCWSLLDKCVTLFHNASLTTVTDHYGSRIAYEQQSGPIWNERDNLWQATAEFTAKLQKT